MATAHKQGSLYLKAECGGIIKLLNVLYIPSIQKNIISVARLMQTKKFKFQCTKYQGTLSKGRFKFLMKREPLTGMWFLRGQRIVVASVLMVTDGPGNKSNRILTIDMNTAHNRFGHVNEQSLRTTMSHFGIKLTGKLNACPGCLLYKARARGVPKTTKLNASSPGGNFYLDTSGPYSETLKRNRYWVKICDQYSGMSWNYFVAEKSQISHVLAQQFKLFKGHGKKVKYLCLDNAGEHQTELCNTCAQAGVTLEYTAPSTPQLNGVVERRFVTDRTKG
jgi:hypothetical protein